jgi:hypothetical protein
MPIPMLDCKKQTPVNFQTGLKLGRDLRKHGVLADDGGGLKKAILDFV